MDFILIISILAAVCSLITAIYVSDVIYKEMCDIIRNISYLRDKLERLDDEYNRLREQFMKGYFK